VAIVFLGDIASPNGNCSEDLRRSLSKAKRVFHGNDTIVNLEGLIASISVDSATPVLFNHPSIVDVLKQINTRATSLANNHTLDLPFELSSTVRALADYGIVKFGAGMSPEEAAAPARFLSGSTQVLVFGGCWDLLLQHQPGQFRRCCAVNPLQPDRILGAVRRARLENEKAIIILLMHWSFDLEKLPFPMYRQLAKDLIDAGANAVIGSHAHCVQGGERHGKGIVVYGLGNFFVPWYTFINGTIHFPEFSREQLALEWDPLTGEARCHWFRYENSEERHRVIYEGSNSFDDCARLRTHSLYAGMGNAEYLRWFRANRRKNRLIPIYRDYRHSVRNSLRDKYLRLRIGFARFLATRGLREWNN